MPLHKGSSRTVISQNIREMLAAGHPQNQAVAAALHTAHPGGSRAAPADDRTRAELTRAAILKRLTAKGK